MQFPFIPALLITILLSSCGGLTPPSSNSTSSAGGDCGVFAADGQSCFEMALGSCSPSTVLLFDKVPPVSAKIEGAVGGSSCTVSLRGLNKAEIDKTMLDNSASQFEVDQMNSKIDSSFSNLEGKTATCVVDKLKAQEFAGSYVYMCSGPLIDEINALNLVKKFG